MRNVNSAILFLYRASKKEAVRDDNGMRYENERVLEYVEEKGGTVRWSCM